MAAEHILQAASEATSAARAADAGVATRATLDDLVASATAADENNMVVGDAALSMALDALEFRVEVVLLRLAAVGIAGATDAAHNVAILATGDAGRAGLAGSDHLMGNECAGGDGRAWVLCVVACAAAGRAVDDVVSVTGAAVGAGVGLVEGSGVVGGWHAFKRCWVVVVCGGCFVFDKILAGCWCV